MCVAKRMDLLPQNVMLLPRFPPFMAFNVEKHQKTRRKKQKNEIKIACYHIFLLTMEKQEKVLPIPQ